MRKEGKKRVNAAQIVCLALTLLLVSACASTASRSGNDVMERVGIGMYSVHKSVAEDLRGTLKALAAMGYKGIEFYGEPKDFPAGEVVAALNESGMVMTSWHIEWRNLQPETIEGTIRYCKQVGLKNVIIPCLGSKWEVGHTLEQECEQVWLDYLPRIEAVRARLAQEGIRCGYHNHEHEFQLNYSGKSVFDLLFGTFNPAMIMEFDTGNAIEGGADPATVIRRYAGRDQLIHLKPWGNITGFEVLLGGAGDENDYPAIIDAAKDTADWFLIESEDFRIDELENARACLEAFRNIVNKK